MNIKDFNLGAAIAGLHGAVIQTGDSDTLPFPDFRSMIPYQDARQMGLYYVVAGDIGRINNLAMCACSILSARLRGFAGPAKVILDADAAGPDIDRIGALFYRLGACLHPTLPLPFAGHCRSQREYAFGVKTIWMSYVDTALALYLDVDTMFLQNPVQVAGYMAQEIERARYNGVAAPSIGVVRDLTTVGNHIASNEDRRLTLGTCGDAQQYGSGVMLVTSGDWTGAFANEWHKEWCRLYGDDQLALMRVMWSWFHDPQKKRVFCDLPFVYNEIRDKPQADTVIWHLAGHPDKVSTFRMHFPEAYLAIRAYLKAPQEERMSRKMADALHTGTGLPPNLKEVP